MSLPHDLNTLLDFADRERYDSAIPAPEAVLGYRLGERLSRHADVMRLLETLAEASPRARLERIGRSVEGRELAQLVVSSPRNLERLAAVRAAFAVLADPTQPMPQVDDLPVAVWIIANVHGGEHSSGEAAMALAQHLCAARDEATAALLESVVVTIEPLQNPDGRDRSVNAYYALHGLRPNPDPNSAEHSPPWPGGRGSHYAFDLNRDWCLLTHPETRARVAAFLAQRPQVVADLHEMGSAYNYYFPPPALPIEANVPPSLRAWWEVFGRANAAAFDARGWDYFVKETFDSFYPGYGEAWPLYHGAVGMTYEQASPQTLAIRRPDGSILTLREAIAQHFVAALTTCSTAAAHRRQLLEHYRRFHEEAVALPADAPRAFALDAGERAADARDVAELLAAQGVTVHVAGEAFSAEAMLLGEATPEQRNFAAGSVVIPLAQPAGRLVRALFEPQPEMPEGFVQEERERVRGRARPNVYDITSWSLPDRHGLAAYALADAPAPAPPAPTPPSSTAGMAYLAPCNTRAGYRLACRLIGAEGWRVRVAAQPLVIGGRRYDRGTLVIRLRDHDSGMPARLAALAAEVGAELVGVDTAWSEDGVSLGSIFVEPVESPKVALVTRPPVSAQAAGWVTYLLEQVYELPYTPLEAGSLSAKVLRDYNVLLLPDSTGYGRVFGEGLLRGWLSAGGTLVALGGAAGEFVVDSSDKLTTVTRLKDLRRVGQEPGPADDRPVPVEHRPSRLPGVTALVDLDPYSYLTYGCPRRLRVPLATDRIFTPSVEGYNIARFPTDGPVLAAGFALGPMREALAGQVYLWQERIGDGQVVCFADAPTFRASWPMLDRLWLNAVLFGPSRRRE